MSTRRPGKFLLSITFSSFPISEPILRAIGEEGYTTPTPIQAKSIPLVLEGRDVLGCAQTGTGKTAAFAVPILHRLVSGTAPTAPRAKGAPAKKFRALVLSPTRELASQIADSFKTYGRHSGLTGAVIFGGVGQRPQEDNLRRGIDILVATPGRLLDLTDQGLVDFSGVEVFVLDEADRMLDMGFIKPIRDIAARLPKARQTLLFSATMPTEIQRLAESLLRNPAKVSVAPVSSAAPLIEQSVYIVDQQTKQGLLAAIVGEEKVARAVVFTKTKHGADKVCKRLVQSGIAAVAIHGNKNQNQRIRSLDAFKSGRTKVLVATDVAARGLDVDGITHVINYDLPMEPESYVHRIGRTGRAGATGVAIAFCDPQAERLLLRDIERLTGKRIPVNPKLPELPPPPPKDMTQTPSARPEGGRQGHRQGPHQGPRQGHHDGQQATTRTEQPRRQHPAQPHGHSRGQSHGQPHELRRDPRDAERQPRPAGHGGGRPERQPQASEADGRPRFTEQPPRRAGMGSMGKGGKGGRRRF